MRCYMPSRSGESYERGKMVIVMCDNSVIVSSLDSRSIKGEAIDPLQLIFFIAEIYDNLVGMIVHKRELDLFRLQLEKIANLFPQLQISPNHRAIGNAVSALRARLHISFWYRLAPRIRSNYSVRFRKYEVYTTLHRYTDLQNIGGMVRGDDQTHDGGNCAKLSLRTQESSRKIQLSN